MQKILIARQRRRTYDPKLIVDPCGYKRCKSSRLICVAKNLVNSTLCTAINLIRDDSRGYLLYKRPGTKDEDVDYSDSDEPEIIDWVTIGNYNISDGLSQVRDFIRNWDLSPATKFVLEPRSERNIQGRGRHIFVEALFSKPTFRCPNPLAVAMVHFTLHVSSMLPDDYPIMVTYRFEGFKSIYYALGERAVRSVNFQRFFIDTILHIKLSFYSKLCECSPSQRKQAVRQEGKGAEGEESFNTTTTADQVLTKKVEGEGIKRWAEYGSAT